MLTQYGVLKPDLPRAGYQEELLERWRKERTQQQEIEVDPSTLNVRFVHDPFWHEHLFSLQCVVDSRKSFDWRVPLHWVWSSVSLLFIIAIYCLAFAFGLKSLR